MADEEKKEEQQEGADEAAKKEEAEGKGSEAESNSADKSADDDVKDKHGQPGINKERHEKEMAAKDAKIAELEAQVAEAAKTDESRKELQKQIDELKAAQADERITHKLELAGCKNAKAAKALLDDYDGDVAKLKAECPYLFEGEKKSGSTGGKPSGAPSDKEKRLKEARQLAGIRTKE